MKRNIKRQYLILIGIALLCLLITAPAAGAVSLQNEGADCAGETLMIDLLSEEHTLQLTAAAEDAEQGVTWRSSDKSVATVSEDGLVTGLKKGTVTITATSAGDTTDKASCKIKVTNLAKEISITGDDTAVGGQSIKLKVEVLPVAATSKKVAWESSDPEAATVSTAGTVKTMKTEEPKSAVVTATAQDGSGAKAEWTIVIFPAPQEGCLLYGGCDCTAETLLIDLLSGINTVQLDAGIQPFDAIQSVTWRSSDKSVATVSEDGLVTGLKKGAVTITATSTSSTAVKATCKVKVTNLAKEINIEGVSTVVGGEGTTLKAEVLPAETASKKVVWESADPEIATVSATGAVKTQATEKIKTVTITATAEDGSGVLKQQVITVIPAVQEVSLQHKGEDCTLEIFTIDLSTEVDTLMLSATIFPAAADQSVIWQSSDESVATVSEDGTVTGYKKGTATISATSVDGKKPNGSKIKAFCTVKVTYSVQTVIIIGPDTLNAGDQVTYEAEVQPEEAFGGVLAWSLMELGYALDDPNEIVVKGVCPENVGVINHERGTVTIKKDFSDVYMLLLVADPRDGGSVRGFLTINVLPQ